MRTIGLVTDWLKRIDPSIGGGVRLPESTEVVLAMGMGVWAVLVFCIVHFGHGMLPG